MKYGMNLLLWTTHVTPTHFPLLTNLKQAGFDGVEIPLFEGDETHFKTIGRELKNAGLECTAVTICTTETNPISPDAAVRKKAADHHRWALDMAHVLGCSILAGPFHSALGVFSGTGPTEDEKKRAADVLRQTAEEAQKRNIVLAIEYLNRFECYFLTTAVDTLALLKRVSHPNMRMMYDTFHAHIEEKNHGAAIRTAESNIVHIHISENDRGTPGTGLVNWLDAFKALKEIKYDGWLTIEAFGRALPDLAAATRVWRDLFSKPEDVYAGGLRFLKKMVSG